MRQSTATGSFMCEGEISIVDARNNPVAPNFKFSFPWESDEKVRTELFSKLRNRVIRITGNREGRKVIFVKAPNRFQFIENMTLAKVLAATKPEHIFV